MADPRPCTHCGKPLVRRAREGNWNFDRRKYCSWHCRDQGRRIPPDQLRANRIALNARNKQRVRDETAGAATQHGQEWTVAEIVVAQDRTLSARAAALQIRRSIDTVKKMRRLPAPVIYRLSDQPGDAYVMPCSCGHRYDEHATHSQRCQGLDSYDCPCECPSYEANPNDD